MTLLNTFRTPGRNIQAWAESRQFPTSFTGQPHDADPALFCYRYRSNDIRTVTAGCDGNKHIGGTGQSAQLPAEYLVIAVVVANGAHG